MRKLIFILVLILIAPFCLCGCAQKSKDYKEQQQTRFIIIERYKDGVISDDYIIIVDKQTRIMYLKYVGAYRGGITPLLDENGNPQRYEGEL